MICPEQQTVLGTQMAFYSKLSGFGSAECSI